MFLAPPLGWWKPLAFRREIIHEVLVRERARITGRFRLNAELPIPFDVCGRMEVDLLCAEARVVVELDGPQHLDNVEAYRRDRRKDILLQESGYQILRFLAEDVGKRLDDVLDAILRALEHQTRNCTR